MAEQYRDTRRTPRTPESQEESAKVSPHLSEKGDRLKSEMDRLLDEIDDLLEENAEEFMRSYIQRGGQ